jgi:murein DD-endopeptidase MepM/ murein hydrolase activator NlpD
MIKKYISNHRKISRKIAILLIVLNFISASSAFGQTAPADTSSADSPDIFPFASTSDNTTDTPAIPDKATDNPAKYSEDVYDVTNNGVYDPNGNLVNPAQQDNAPINNAANTVSQNADSNGAQNSFEAYKESIIANWGGKVEFTKRRLADIQTSMEEEKKHFASLEQQINDVQDKMDPIKQKIQSLQDEIDLLNRQSLIADKKIQSIELQVAEKQVALRDLFLDVSKSEVALDAQKKIALDYIILVYHEEEKFTNLYDNGSSTLKLLLADNSVTENLNGLEYSKVLEATGRKVFYDLFNEKVKLEDKQQQVEKEKADLDWLNTQLVQERDLLQEGKMAKKDLLEKTMGQEEEYQKLLDQSTQQQLESAIAIQNMQDNSDFIQQKLSLLDDSIQQAKTLTAPEDAKVNAVPINPEANVGALNDVIQKEFAPDPVKDLIPAVEKFIWPVPPNAITAYFHDPNYPKQWGVHNAIDIRAPQFTEIHAPANGYVFQTKDNGMGYSYIILAHKNKLITVYGHVTKILVKPGTVVKQGDVIGLSGGTPGTKGAGWQTTGAHLHFEVWHDGKQVDPLDWLPVMELPLEYIPNRYLTVQKPH